MIGAEVSDISVLFIELLPNFNQKRFMVLVNSFLFVVGGGDGVLRGFTRGLLKDYFQ